jgi:hypothetical protein
MPAPLSNDVSPDRAERIQDFLSRHGGQGPRAAHSEEIAPEVQGWSEVYAADGYTLRCEWSRFGTHEDMKYSEIPPAG